MKINITNPSAGTNTTVNPDPGAVVLLHEVFNGVALATEDGETISIVMRDNGFEFVYGMARWSAKNGVVEKMGDLTDSAEVKTEFKHDIVMKAGERLYRHVNPESTMDVPSMAYETAEKWFNEWLATTPRVQNTDAFVEWCLQNKQPKK